MSYYQYLSRYAPRFLARYQTETYAHLQRSSAYAEIVHMNATSTLSVDEDITLNFKAPYNLTNFMAFMCLVYWYFYHVDMYAANSLRNRLRSYHNYKMWSRLEVAVRKNNVEAGRPVKKMIEDKYLKENGITREQYLNLVAKCKDGEEAHEVLASMGLKWDKIQIRVVQLAQ